MAQWDGVGDVNDWGEYIAGERATPPAAQLDANSRRAALEQAAVIAKVRQDRALRLFEYVTRNGVRL